MINIARIRCVVRFKEKEQGKVRLEMTRQVCTDDGKQTKPKPRCLPADHTIEAFSVDFGFKTLLNGHK